MKRKIIIALCSLLITSHLYAKNRKSNSSWGKITTHNKYGDKKVIKNSKLKSSSFSHSDRCKKYIYIDTYSSFRTKDYILHWFGSFQSGYATTKVTIGNDSNSCRRKAFVVPYLLITQKGGPRGGISRAWKEDINKSFILRMSMAIGGIYNDYNTNHTV